MSLGICHVSCLLEVLCVMPRRSWPCTGGMVGSGEVLGRQPLTCLLSISGKECECLLGLLSNSYQGTARIDRGFIFDRT